MAQIAVLKIDTKTGALKCVDVKANDKEALESIKTAGNYVLVEVHEVKPKK